MTEYKSTRIAFGEALLELAEEGLDLVAISADTSKSMGIGYLKSKYPQRCFDCGIAEQNMMMVAAGFASTGKTAFVASYSVFTSMRALEQLRTFICYPNLNVKIAAGLGGFSAGIEGVTHTALEDLGIVRCIPNLVIVNPADYYSTINIVKNLSQLNGPAYIRLGREASPIVFDKNYSFKIGKANLILDKGEDIGIITSGIILAEVLIAAKELDKKGIKYKLMELPTLKPVDEEAIINLGRTTEKIVTIEEHNIIGGLYSAVSEVICRNHPAEVFPISVPDKFTESGLPSELRKKYKLDSTNIVKKIVELVGNI